MSQVTVRQAALLAGKSRDTINVATKEGTLSFTLNPKGHKVINVAELERVFPLVKTMDDLDKPQAAVGSRPNVSDSDVRMELALIRERLKHSQQLFDTMSIERGRERSQLESEIENLRDSLEKAQDQQTKMQLMLTDQTNDRVGRYEEIQQQIHAQTVRFEKELSGVTKQARQDAMNEYKNYPWWQLAFGKKLQA